MWKLLRKDFVLTMHPVTPFFLLLSAMVLIPNYPYSVVFFYTGLSLFFTCLAGRENRDIPYTLFLPVRRRDVVAARMAFAVCLQLAQLALAGLLGVLSQRLYPGNVAGLEPNLAFLGWGLMLYALFNAVFFGVYYRNVERVGWSFLASSVVVFAGVAAEVISTYAVPFVREVLDTKDPAFLPQKLAVLLLGVLLYLLSLALTYRSAARHFERQDVAV